MCPYTPTAGRAASALQWLARPCGVFHLGQSTCMAWLLPAFKLPTIKNPNCAYDHESRGESGWCSDMTSTHGVWRHTGVRFLLSGAAAVLTSVLQRLQLPRPSVGRSLIRLLPGVWRHTGVRFLVTRAAAVVTSVPQQLQPSWPSVGRLLIRCLFPNVWMDKGSMHRPPVCCCAVHAAAAAEPIAFPYIPTAGRSCVRAAVARAALRCFRGGQSTCMAWLLPALRPPIIKAKKLCSTITTAGVSRAGART